MNKAIFVIGPTATGKTSLGVDLARFLDSEIISIDSRQVYRGLDLGTGKDLAEFGTGDNAVKYHLIDNVDPATESYSLHQFLHDAVKTMQDIWQRGKIPIFVGGTSLYTNALLSQYEVIGCEPNFELRRELEKKSLEELRSQLQKFPHVYEKTDLSTKKRVIRGLEIALNPDAENCLEIPQFEKLILAPYHDRKVCHKRIEKRLDERLEEGMIEEVHRLHDEGVSWEKLDWFGLEYRYVSKFLKGELGRQEMRDKLFIKIRQFLKSQDIWLRKMEREGKTIYWLPDGSRSLAKGLINKFLADERLPQPVIKISEITYGPKSQ